MPKLQPADQIQFTCILATGISFLASGIFTYISSRKITATPFIHGMVTAVRHDEKNNQLAVVEYRDSMGQKQKYFWKCLAMPSLGQSVKLALSPTGDMEIAEKGHHFGRAIILMTMGLGCVVGAAAVLSS